MTHTRYPPMKDRTRIGEVRFLMDEILEARATGACCVHVEAALEPETATSFSKKSPRINLPGCPPRTDIDRR